MVNVVSRLYCSDYVTRGLRNFQGFSFADWTQQHLPTPLPAFQAMPRVLPPVSSSVTLWRAPQASAELDALLLLSLPGLWSPSVPGTPSLLCGCPSLPGALPHLCLCESLPNVNATSLVTLCGFTHSHFPNQIDSPLSPRCALLLLLASDAVTDCSHRCHGKAVAGELGGRLLCGVWQNALHSTAVRKLLLD